MIIGLLQKIWEPSEVGVDFLSPANDRYAFTSADPHIQLEVTVGLIKRRGVRIRVGVIFPRSIGRASVDWGDSVFCFRL